VSASGRKSKTGKGANAPHSTNHPWLVESFADFQEEYHLAIKLCSFRLAIFMFSFQAHKNFWLNALFRSV
jgi:hypothetical protein